MSGGFCGLTSAKVASIITIVIGSVSIILGIVTIALDNNDFLYIGIPALIGGTMLSLEGVFCLIYAFHANNKCWIITTLVVSIIMLVISVALLIGSAIFSAIYISFQESCNACDGPDDYCESCSHDFEHTIPGGVIMIVYSIISIVTSIIMLVVSSRSLCCKSNMDSAPTIVGELTILQHEHA